MTSMTLSKALAAGAVVLVVGIWLALVPLAFVIRLLLDGTAN